MIVKVVKFCFGLIIGTIAVVLWILGTVQDYKQAIKKQRRGDA